jgi:hypothetical protein
MGSFFTNLHIRNTSSAAICAALPRLLEGRAYVSPESCGWVTVYCEATESQDDETMRELAGGLSRMLKTEALGFLVHDSDIAMYWLYRDGVLADEFNSAPDYYGGHMSEKTRARVHGNAEALLPLCIAGTVRDQLEAALHPPDSPPFAEEIVAELAKLLGIDEARATLGFNYFDEEGAEILPDIDQFEPVGEGANRKQPDPESRAAAAAAPQVDAYPIAITMLTQTWNSKFSKGDPKIVSLFGKNTESMIRQMRDAFDKQSHSILKQSQVPNLPTIDELIAARNQGPNALAELIARKTPSQLAEIGVSATVYGLGVFVAALLKCGLDPNAEDPRGQTTLRAAENHGKDSSIYRLVKSAAEKNP